MKPDDTMTIKPYSRLVSLTVRPEHVFHFPNGLPAFEEFHDFVFAIKPDTSPFIFMHALEPAGLSFVCIDPFHICPEYAPRISLSDQAFLGDPKAEGLMLLSIVTVRADVRETTANLQAPLAINIENSIGRQILCEGQSYPIRYRIWNMIEAAEAAPEGSEDHIAEPGTPTIIESTVNA